MGGETLVTASIIDSMINIVIDHVYLCMQMFNCSNT